MFASEDHFARYVCFSSIGNQVDLAAKASSIIYRLICKTHYTIILHQRVDILAHEIFLLYQLARPSLANSCVLSLWQTQKKTKQVQASTAELRVLKSEILRCQRMYSDLQTVVTLKIPCNEQY